MKKPLSVRPERKVRIQMIKYICKYLFLSVIGGIIYILIELAFRGRSHWSMFILGGLCFICLGLINEVIPWKMPLACQMAIGGAVITVLEFFTGCIVNLWLGWGVWDYTSIPLNILGQICLPFSLIWFVLSAVGIILDDYVRYWFFKEEKPAYTVKL